MSEFQCSKRRVGSSRCGKSRGKTARDRGSAGKRGRTGVDLKKGGVKSQTQIEVYADREDDSTQSQPTPPQRGPDKAKEPVPKVEAETQTTSLVVATPKTEEGSGCSQPSSGAKRGARSVGRRKKTGKRSTARSNDDEYAPSTRRRQVQQSIKDLFPVRRSTRRCKTALENEELERFARKLRTKDEEGLKVVEVEGKGRGVVSTRPFRRGELVCEYSGELISHEEAKRREEEYSGNSSIGCYMYYFSFKTKKLCVDATKDNGRLGRLLNHSKTAANVATRLHEIDGDPYLCLMAARDVQPGEELVYDYGERSSEALLSHPWLAS